MQCQCLCLFCCLMTFYVGTSKWINSLYITEKKSVVRLTLTLNYQTQKWESTGYFWFVIQRITQPEEMLHQGLILRCEITILRKLNYRSFLSFGISFFLLLLLSLELYSYVGHTRDYVCEECYRADISAFWVQSNSSDFVF